MRTLKLYVVGVVLLPPKSVVDKTPAEERVTLAVARLDPTSEKVIALSEEPASVANVPEKLPAKVPKEPAEVVNDGAVEAVIILFVLRPALPSGFSILT